MSSNPPAGPGASDGGDASHHGSHGTSGGLDFRHHGHLHGAQHTAAALAASHAHLMASAAAATIGGAALSQSVPVLSDSGSAGPLSFGGYGHSGSLNLLFNDAARHPAISHALAEPTGASMDAVSAVPAQSGYDLGVMRMDSDDADLMATGGHHQSFSQMLSSPVPGQYTLIASASRASSAVKRSYASTTVRESPSVLHDVPAAGVSNASMLDAEAVSSAPGSDGTRASSNSNATMMSTSVGTPESPVPTLPPRKSVRFGVVSTTSIASALIPQQGRTNDQIAAALGMRVLAVPARSVNCIERFGISARSRSADRASSASSSPVDSSLLDRKSGVRPQGTEVMLARAAESIRNKGSGNAILHGFRDIHRSEGGA